jgi:hypothetical protein
MEKPVFYLESSNEKELEKIFLEYLAKDTTEEDKRFAMSERGQELRKILGLSEKNNKIGTKSVKRSKKSLLSNYNALLSKLLHKGIIHQSQKVTNTIIQLNSTKNTIKKLSPSFKKLKQQ